jgi:hypothetical protein
MHSPSIRPLVPFVALLGIAWLAAAAMIAAAIF